MENVGGRSSLDFGPMAAALAARLYNPMQTLLNLFYCWKELELLCFEGDTQASLPSWYRGFLTEWNKCGTGRSLPVKQQESFKTYTSRDTLKVWNKHTSFPWGKTLPLSSSIIFNFLLQNRQFATLPQNETTLINVKSCLSQAITYKQQN